MTLTIGLVAGEASGDNLAAGLMAAIKAHPAMSEGVRFIGVGGPAMLAQGLESLASIDELSVNGFKEPHLALTATVETLSTAGRDFCAPKTWMLS